MKWALWDYGVGNLHSLHKALESIGEIAIITREPKAFLAADVAVLPGVGAFDHVLESLAPVAEGLLQRHVAGKPILGVCIGMQAMYQSSDEGTKPGLGIMQGHVKKLGANMVPHMGWNDVQGDVSGVCYYVHSYAASPAGALATTEYGGETFAAAIRQKNTIGFQFHPEKSGPDGKTILKWVRDQYRKQA